MVLILRAAQEVSLATFGITGSGDDARRDLKRVTPVMTACDRDIAKKLTGKVGGLLSGLCVDERSVTSNFDDLALRTNLQLKVDGDIQTCTHDETCALESLKAGDIGLHTVMLAGGQLGEAVVAFRVRGCCEGAADVRAARGDLGVGPGGPAGIGDMSLSGAISSSLRVGIVGDRS